MIASFPFFHVLCSKYPDSELNVIVNSDLFDLYKVLPFDLKLHSFPDDKDTLFGIHHYSYNLFDVFNIDIFFDLQNTFKSSFMGFCFRAHERIGIETGFNKFFLTKKHSKRDELFFDKYYLDIIESYLNVKNENLKIAASNDSNNVVYLNAKKEKKSFLVIINDIASKGLWKSFFDSFFEQNFLVWYRGKNEELFEEFQKELDNKNSYKMICQKGLFVELLDFMSDVSCAFTDEFWTASISSYYGVQSFVFLEELVQIPELSHFSLVPSIVHFDSKLPVSLTIKNERKQIDDMSGLVDSIHEILKL